MQVTLSSKGQLVLPAPIRRRLRLKARSKVELEERDGGVFHSAGGEDCSPCAYQLSAARFSEGVVGVRNRPPKIERNIRRLS